MESTAEAEPVRIFLIGLSEGFARSLARYVGRDARVALAGVAPTLALAALMLPVTKPHLALLDWTALNAAPGDTVQALRRGQPDLSIFCVVNENEPYRGAAAQAGADAVISKDWFAKELEVLLPCFFPERFSAAGGRND